MANNIKTMLPKETWEEIGDVKIKWKKRAVRPKPAALELAEEAPIEAPPNKEDGATE